jgi:hypothetical protein
MVQQVLLMPFSAAWVLGAHRTLLALPLCVLGVLVQMYYGDSPGFLTASAADAVVLGLALALSALAGLLFWLGVGPLRMQPLLKNRPFSGAALGVAADVFGACPLSNRAPERRCPVCSSFVAKGVFHEAKSLDLPASFSVIVDWGSARQAMARQDDPLLGRIMLDEALDFECNLLWCTIASCCHACAVYSTAWRVLPMSAILYASAGIIFAELPVLAPQITAYAGLPAAVSFLALLFAQVPLFQAAQALASSAVFLDRFSRRLHPEVSRVTLARWNLKAWQWKVVRCLSGKEL